MVSTSGMLLWTMAHIPGITDLFRDIIRIPLSLRPLTSKICVSWPIGRAKTHSKEDYGLVLIIPDPTDLLHYSNQAYSANIVWL